MTHEPAEALTPPTADRDPLPQLDTELETELLGAHQVNELDVNYEILLLIGKREIVGMLQATADGRVNRTKLSLQP